MPLAAAGLLLVLCAALSAVSFRAYRRTGGRKFLAGGIVSMIVSVAAVAYFGAVWLLVSGIK
jgi:hypothetical protein